MGRVQLPAESLELYKATLVGAPSLWCPLPSVRELHLEQVSL